MGHEGCIDHEIRGKCIPGESVRDGVDHFIGELADRQYGIVGRQQLLSAGVNARAIEERLRLGRLHLIHHGVYSVGYPSVGREGRWFAAVLASGSGAVLSHRSAGQLWRILSRSGALPEVTRPRRFRARPGIIARRSSLPIDEVEEVDGIPVTSVSRTLFDLAAVVSRRELEKALNEAEILRLTDRLSLPDLLQRYPRRKGSAALRALLHDADAGKGVTRSELEERFAALIDAYGLPKPRRNADLALRGRFFKADCLWRRQRVVVELDGRAVHGTAHAFEADRERDRLLVGEGWRVIHLTWLQVRDDAPEIAADLRRALSGFGASEP
jgi:hypothetical protein